jgi:hypothetical protein
MVEWNASRASSKVQMDTNLMPSLPSCKGETRLGLSSSQLRRQSRGFLSRYGRAQHSCPGPPQVHTTLMAGLCLLGGTIQLNLNNLQLVNLRLARKSRPGHSGRLCRQRTLALGQGETREARDEPQGRVSHRNYSMIPLVA